jgi:hypothetical protein
MLFSNTLNQTFFRFNQKQSIFFLLKLNNKQSKYKNKVEIVFWACQQRAILDGCAKLGKTSHVLQIDSFTSGVFSQFKTVNKDEVPIFLKMKVELFGNARVQIVQILNVCELVFRCLYFCHVFSFDMFILSMLFVGLLSI